MALKVFQVKPSVDTLTTLYTCPSAKESVVSTVSVANIGADASFRIAVRKAGQAISDEMYIVYEATISAGESKFFTIGIAMEASDVISVFTKSGSIAFNAFVNEVDA
jgi:hypothetical protein